MTELLPFLKKLISAPGLSGYEAPIRSLIKEEWEPLTDELSTSRLGSLHALHKGTGKEPKNSILLAAHMDAIGLMVTRVVQGFLYVTSIGGVDPRVLPGQLVTVHGREDLPGLVVPTPPKLLPAKYQSSPIPMEHILVDTGLLPEEVSQLVRTGDLVSFAQEPIETAGDTLSGHSLDNRASVAALTICLQELQYRPHLWDVWAVATVQEEVTLGGAHTSGFQLKPTIAVAIDVTFGSSPGSPEHRTFPLGEGLALGWGPNIHPKLHASFKDLAQKLEIPYQLEVMPANSGTDAVALQVAAGGAPAMVISIPLRYMHTPVEMVSLKDVTRTGRLLAEFITRLDDDFVKKLAWEETE
ncbi:MAG: M42 family peptidase [Chloroflexi bacterium]|nr:MAG: M42 family peptidase [Chloroflexota bacterium]